MSISKWIQFPTTPYTQLFCMEVVAIKKTHSISIKYLVPFLRVKCDLGRGEVTILHQFFFAPLPPSEENHSQIIL